VRPCNSCNGDWGGGACMRAMVLRCAVARANDGGGVHTCVGPTSSSHMDDGSLDPMSCISLFLKKLL
jgi:hypothetical protein